MDSEDPVAIQRFIDEAEEAMERLSTQHWETAERINPQREKELSGLIFGLGALQLIWILRLNPNQHEPWDFARWVDESLIDVPDDWTERDDWECVDGEPVWMPGMSHC